MKANPILTSSIIVAAATIFVRVFGFLREITLAATHGAGLVSDAFVIAFTVPSIVLAIVASSANAAFIPMYSRLGEDRGRFTNNVLTLLVAIGLVFAIVFTIVPQALTFLFASQLDSETFALATEFLRVMVWSAVPILFMGILQSYLQIHKAFFLAAILVIPVNISAIASIYLSGYFDNVSIIGYGIVAGNVIMLLLLFAAVRRKGHIFRLVLKLRTPELKEFVILLSPVLLSTLIADVNVIIDRNFAATLEVGSISSLNFAVRTVNIITVLFGASIATVLFPRMSELAAKGDITDIQSHVIAYISKLAPILLPAIAGIFLLAEPITRVLFERGEFLPADTVRTAQALRMYAPLLLAGSVNVVLVRTFFALHDTKTPAIISLISLAVGIVLRFLLVEPLQHMGLALSTSAAGLVSTVMLLAVLRRRIGTLRLRSNWAEWLKTGAATIVMGAVVLAGARFLPVMEVGTMQSLLLTFGLVVTGMGVYILALLVMRSAFLRDMVALVRGVLHFRKNR